MSLSFKLHSIYSIEEPPSSEMLPWLQTPHSLTDKLKASLGSVDLVVLSQKWSQTSWWERFTIDSQCDSVFQREILMRSGAKEYWYARTMIPKACYDSGSEFFSRLENESIRNLIFESDEVRCTGRIYYPINVQCQEYHWVTPYKNDIESTLWLRLAEYSYCNEHCFYLAEILFPDVEGI